MIAPSYYVSLGDHRFRATDATVGPWDPRLQHGSPPAALLARAIERGLPRDDARIARVDFHFLGPVAVGELTVEAEVVRPGARVERSRARLSVAGRVAMEANAWRIAVAPGRVPAVAVSELPPAFVEEQPTPRFGDVAAFGYAESLEWRFAEGDFETPGPAAAWTRPRVPLVEGEETSPLGRLLLMVDSANGISAELPPSRYTFVPVQLSVSLLRHPCTDWVAMRARTAIDPDGVGLTRADLFDEQGAIGVATQTLFVAAR